MLTLMRAKLLKFVINFIIYFCFVEKEVYQDLEDGLSHEYLSYEDLVTLSIKQSIDATRKLRRIQNRINPGGSEIFPYVLTHHYNCLSDL